MSNTNARHGRCERCAVVYHWSGLPLVRDAQCTLCGDALGRSKLLAPAKRHLYEAPLSAVRKATA
jgi:hypothetical protein